MRARSGPWEQGGPHSFPSGYPCSPPLGRSPKSSQAPVCGPVRLAPYSLFNLTHTDFSLSSRISISSISTWLLFAVTVYWSPSPYPALARLSYQPLSSGQRIHFPQDAVRETRAHSRTPRAPVLRGSEANKNQRAHTHVISKCFTRYIGN